MIHQHSRLAWRTFPATEREKEVLECIELHGVLTDREVCGILGQEDMNYARPTITNLIDRGILAEYDEKRCPVTRKIVRRVYFGDGTPREKPRTTIDILKEYFTIAERHRQESLYPVPEWESAANAVRSVLDA